MKVTPQTCLLGITGTLLVFYFILDIRLSRTCGIALAVIWMVSFYLDMKSTFARPELFEYESNVLLVLLCKKLGIVAGCAMLGCVELLLILMVTFFFNKGDLDWISFSVVAACVGVFHLLWYHSNKQFAKNINPHVK